MGLVFVGGHNYLYRIHSVVGVMTYIFVPIAFFILIYALSSIRPYELDAARTLGATDYEIITRLVIPRTTRQAIIGAFLISANALGYFVTPHMLGGGNFDMLGNLIWKNINHLGLFSDASSLSISLLIVLSPFYFLSFLLIVRNRQRVLGR
jgi:ABC-type spermidine/putrescine transport system permease subunit I